MLRKLLNSSRRLLREECEKHGICLSSDEHGNRVYFRASHLDTNSEFEVTLPQRPPVTCRLSIIREADYKKNDDETADLKRRNLVIEISKNNDELRRIVSVIGSFPSEKILIENVARGICEIEADNDMAITAVLSAVKAGVLRSATKPYVDANEGISRSAEGINRRRSALRMM